MSKTRSKTGNFVFLLTIIATFFINQAKADDDTADDRARLVSRRNDRFYKTDITRHFIALSAEYDSDEDSKQYIFKLDHYFKNRKWISDIELRMETLFKNESSTNAKRTKKSNDYRAIIAEKIVLFDTDNYFILFNETRYDDKADSSYYDIVTAAGFGKMFFDDRLEIDLGYGFSKAKEINSVSHHWNQRRFDYDRDIWVPSFRTEFEIFDDIRFISRGYAYFSGDIDSYYLNTRFQYPISKKVYLQLTHLFDKRTYEKYDSVSTNYNVAVSKVNQIQRQILLGFRYDFGRGN